MAANRTHFGEVVDYLLDSRSMNQSELARASGLYQPHISAVQIGVRVPSAKFVAAISGALRLNDRERKSLHALAAKENGFDIELPPLP